MKKAFTLIELLIVLIIIGVIVTLAVPQYEKWLIRVRGAEAMTNLQIKLGSVSRGATSQFEN